MTSTPINVGFIGLSATGWASRALGPSLLQPALHDRYTLTAVSTSNEQSANASAKKYTEELGHPVKAYYGDSSKIAADPKVDLVVVSVKAPLHKQVLLPVIAAKKDFFIEWPAGTDLKETTEIAEAARKQGVRGFVGLQGRQAPFVKKVSSHIESTE
jgi:predicted dehydrogenase